MANLETILQNDIRLHVGEIPGVRIFRNNVGLARAEHGGYVKYGLCDGSSDLIGFVSRVITPDMVGQKIAVFAALEVKTPGKYPSKTQKAFLSVVQVHGGIAGVVRSKEEAEALCNK